MQTATGLVGCSTSNGQIERLALSDGSTAVGRAYVDSTADGNLSALAGASFQLGRDGDGLLQPATLTFRAGPVNVRAFGITRSGHYNLCIMNADGTNPVNLTPDSFNDTYFSITPDGKKILFSSERATPGKSQLFSMNFDGSAITRLTFDTPVNMSPVMNAAVTKIAFQSDRSGNNEIYVMNADGSAITNVTNNAAADSSPSFSPDGTKLAFIATRTGNAEIDTMNVDGSSVTRLTTTTGAEAFPVWTKVSTVSNANVESALAIPGTTIGKSGVTHARRPTCAEVTKRPMVLHAEKWFSNSSIEPKWSTHFDAPAVTNLAFDSIELLQRKARLN